MIKGKQEDVRKKDGNKIQVRKVQKHYTKPQLMEYGHIEKLTQSGGTGPIDSPGGSRGPQPR
ncbi:MAG: hypothetical protein LUQ65_04440 [Candidatus Helarchaeota archaeon]|nr:hypothetical protein [Candidatus Helarchaeota archaeon]